MTNINQPQRTTTALSDLVKPMILVVIAILCLIPGYFFSRLHVTDGFLYQIIAYLRLTLPLDHLQTFTRGGFSFGFTEYLPGYPMILSLLSRIGAIPPEQLHFMPIAAIFIPLGYFAFAQKLFKSTALSILLALYGAYDIGLASHYNVFAYTWSNLIYFAFLLVSLRVIQQRQAADIILMFVLFAGSLFLHYATTMWLIVFIFILNGWFFIRERWGKTANSNLVRASFAMPFSFIVAFLTFNQVFYRVWLPSLEEKTTGGSIDPLTMITIKLGSYLGRSVVTTERYQFLNPWGEGFGWWRTAEFVLILLPIGLWFMKIAWDWLTRHSFQPKRPYYFELTIVMIATTLAHWAVYGGHSGINMRYVSLTFPFLTIIAMEQLNFRAWLTKAIIATLTLTAIASYIMGLQYYLKYPPTSYNHTLAGANWFFSHPLQGVTLSDLDTQGLYLVNSIDSGGNFPSTVVYDSNLYGSMIDPTQTPKTPYRFVIVDSALITKPLHGFSNRIYEPFSWHVGDINTNFQLSRIYDDGSSLIFIRPGEDDK